MYRIQTYSMIQRLVRFLAMANLNVRDVLPKNDAVADKEMQISTSLSMHSYNKYCKTSNVESCKAIKHRFLVTMVCLTVRQAYVMPSLLKLIILLAVYAALFLQTTHTQTSVAENITSTETRVRDTITLKS